MPPTIRAFIAIPLPDAVKSALQRLISDLRQVPLGFTYFKPSAMHLTMIFMGDIRAERLPLIQESMLEAAADIPPMTLAPRAIGVFPTVKRARILWTGIMGATDTLRDLHQRLADQLRIAGFSLEKRPFKAHLTLGRARRTAPDSVLLVNAITSLADFTCAPFSADRIILFQSDLKADGPHYTALETVTLGR